jgi:hypothetical protein
VAGNVRRARAPRGAPLAHEGNTLEGQAHGRSGASRAGRPGGAGREGGSQTPHAARGDGGNRRHYSCGSAWPRLCRRATKVQERQHRGTSRSSTHGSTGDAAVRGCNGSSPKEHESARGARLGFRIEVRSGGRPPEGRENAARVGREPIAALVLRVRVPGAPRNSTGDCNGSPRGGVRHPFQPSHLWRATSTKGTDSLVRVC